MKLGKHGFMLDDSLSRREAMRLLTALISGAALLPLTGVAGLAEDDVIGRSGERATKQTSKPNTGKSNGAIMNSKHKDLILQAYAAFNRQDANALLALVGDDVDWPEDDVRLHGKDAVRAYWLKESGQTHHVNKRVVFSIG
ncbi:nuclear transport factor 2 family protein [Nostoc sp.]|uniref:nuclear transport factor 2 family protein n=1 Tax=Nostoc sp. TaxID=1180 RepID=UPI002FFCDF45